MEGLNQEMLSQLEILSNDKDGEFFLKSEIGNECRNFLSTVDLIQPNQILENKKYFKRSDLEKFSSGFS